jgi:hypothetical protein
VLHIEEATDGVFVIARRQLSALHCAVVAAKAPSRMAKARNVKDFIIKIEKRLKTRRVYVLDG